MGGGNTTATQSIAYLIGLSPRGRGKQAQAIHYKMLVRSIPAWAGETIQARKPVRQSEVYPRVGGGNRRPLPIFGYSAGLSPRGRGKPPFTPKRATCLGSIPAWAGETIPGGQDILLVRVYPRVGGGNEQGYILRRWDGGLSPRGRGKRPQATAGTPLRRSIPAWAGETADCQTDYAKQGVYPRVGGGNHLRLAASPAFRGLSPRGRGKRRRRAHRRAVDRSIPAWAGETFKSRQSRHSPAVYPRVGGGNFGSHAYPSVMKGLSPRGRGKPLYIRYRRRIVGSIPAWAGETLIGDSLFSPKGVYPRVGGGNHAEYHRRPLPRGLSPRGRGKHKDAADQRRREWSIPAWAGETVETP